VSYSWFFDFGNTFLLIGRRGRRGVTRGEREVEKAEVEMGRGGTDHELCLQGVKMFSFMQGFI